MSERIGNLTIISQENPQQCDVCGRIAELRPYGENGAMICFDCGMKDETGTTRRMHQYLFGDK